MLNEFRTDARSLCYPTRAIQKLVAIRPDCKEIMHRPHYGIFVTQKSYGLAHILSVLKASSVWNYNQTAFEKTVAKMNQVYAQNGVFVITLHPAYFGFFSYLVRPRNWIPLIKFLARHLKQSSQ